MLTDFFYAVPVGLMRFRLDGSVELSTPLVAKLLMPLLPDGDLSNAYLALSPVCTDLERRLLEFRAASGIVLDHERYPVSAGGRRMVLSLTIHRIHCLSQIAIIEDVTAIVKQEQQLQRTKADLTWSRHYDALTGLANRRLLELRLDEASIETGVSASVLFVDLDGAKAIKTRWDSAPETHS
jgi:hypothetical protein